MNTTDNRTSQTARRKTLAILDYCGLPFEKAFLKFHETKRAVMTPSAEQVRQPITTKGVDEWRAYEPWLGPLKEALGPALEHWRGEAPWCGRPASSEASVRSAGLDNRIPFSPG